MPRAPGETALPSARSRSRDGESKPKTKRMDGEHRVREEDRLGFELLEFLYNAPGDARAWGVFLEALSDSLSKGALAFFAAQGGEGRPGVLAGRGIGVSLADEAPRSCSAPGPASRARTSSAPGETSAPARSMT